MGMQVSCGVHPEVSAQSDVWVDTQRVRIDHSGVGTAQREQSRGGASDGRPCAHDAVDSTEVLGVRGGGVHQGEERDSDRPKVYGSEEEFCGVELLGEGILGVNGGAGRSASAQLYPRAGERRPTVRSTEDVRVASMPA